jgi:hypothetical protein
MAQLQVILQAQQQQQMILARAFLAGRARNFVTSEEAIAGLDSLLFPLDESAHEARKRLTILLAHELNSINKACALESRQMEKLTLAGRGDITRYFARYESLKESFVATPPSEYQDFLDQSTPLQQTLNDGLFAEKSLFRRTIPHVLTPAQSAKYEKFVRERMRARHLVDIGAACTWLERDLQLSGEQKDKIKRFMLRETTPAHREGLGDIQYLLWQLERLPKEKLNGLVDADQLPKLLAYLKNFKDFRPEPRQTGQWEE